MFPFHLYAATGEAVARLDPTRETQRWEVVYCHRRVATIDLEDANEV